MAVTTSGKTDGTTTVTNALGKQTTYHFDLIHGVYKVSRVEGHASAHCAAANQAYTYDANGYPDQVTDWNGRVTDYDYNPRGLEERRVEALNTPEERTITTEWHADFRLPTRITEPGRETELTYDTQGRLLSHTIRATP